MKPVSDGPRKGRESLNGGGRVALGARAPVGFHRDMPTSSSFDLFAALGDPVRARLIRELAGGSRCTCDLTEPLGLSQPTVSYHLKILKAAGILESLPVGRFTHYRLRPEALATAVEELVHLSASAARHEYDRPAGSEKKAS